MNNTAYFDMLDDYLLSRILGYIDNKICPPDKRFAIAINKLWGYCVREKSFSNTEGWIYDNTITVVVNKKYPYMVTGYENKHISEFCLEHWIYPNPLLLFKKTETYDIGEVLEWVKHYSNRACSQLCRRWFCHFESNFTEEKQLYQLKNMLVANAFEPVVCIDMAACLKSLIFVAENCPDVHFIVLMTVAHVNMDK